MRIVYILPSPMGRTPAGAAEMARRGAKLREWAAPGTTVEIADTRNGPASIESMFEEYITGDCRRGLAAPRRAGRESIALLLEGDGGVGRRRAESQQAGVHDTDQD